MGSAVFPAQNQLSDKKREARERPGEGAVHRRASLAPNQEEESSSPGRPSTQRATEITERHDTLPWRNRKSGTDEGACQTPWPPTAEKAKARGGIGLQEGVVIPRAR